MILAGKKKNIFRLLTTVTIFFFLCPLILPKEVQAARSSAGGGDVSDFSFADFACAAGMSLGSFVIGSAISSALSSGASAIGSGINSGIGSTGGFGSGGLIGAAANAPACGAAIPESLANMGSMMAGMGEVGAAASSVAGTAGASIPVLSNMANGFTGSLSSTFGSWSGFADRMVMGYNTFVVTSQAGRAITMMGAYYKWDPSVTYLASSVGTSAVAGFFNPSASLGSALTDQLSFVSGLQGAGVGALDGLARAGVIIAIDGNKISNGKSPGVGAQIAGMAAGVFGTELGRYCFNNVAYTNTDKARGPIGPGDPFSGALNQWPKMATNALGMLAADKLGDKDNGTFVRATVAGIAGPLLSGLVDNYKLTPELRNMTDTEWGERMKEKYDIETINGNILAQALKNELRTLPAGLISGGIGFAMNKIVDQDNPMQKMMVSFAGTTVSSAIYSVALASYNPELLKGAGLERADTATVLAHSLGRDLMFWGANTLAMGYPAFDARNGLDSSDWDYYTSQLSSYSNSARVNGFWQTIANHSYDVGKSITARNFNGFAADALSDTSIGRLLGRPYIPAIQSSTGEYIMLPLKSNAERFRIPLNKTITNIQQQNPKEF